jgi:hypothetical protein
MGGSDMGLLLLQQVFGDAAYKRKAAKDTSGLHHHSTFFFEGNTPKHCLTAVGHGSHTIRSVFAEWSRFSGVAPEIITQALKIGKPIVGLPINN